jgi:flagellar biogenesis protein FliO
MSVSSPSGATRFSLADRLPLDAPTRQALTTALTGLAVVVGLLLVCTWLLKRSGPTAAGMLPPEAFAVLGRAQLADRSTIVLFRLGSKLVLAATTAEGLRPLTEVTDPTEVDRLAGLCSQGRLHGPAAEFQQVLQQLAREPARGFLDGQTQRGRA